MPARPWTTEPQREFLQSRFNDYLEAKALEDFSKFWPLLYGDWGCQWPENEVLFPGRPLSDNTPDDTEKLKAAIQVRRQQLQSWFRWRASSNGRTVTKQPKILNELFTRSKRLPQKSEIYSKLCYDDKIKPIVTNEAMNLNIKGRDKLKLSNSITRKMYEEEDEETKAKVEARLAELIHARGLTPELGPRTNEQYMDAIQDCAATLGRLLTALADKTGWSFSVLMGGPNPSVGGDVTVASYHVGETSTGKLFWQAHPDFEKSYMEPFTDFLTHVYPPALRQSRALNANPQEMVGMSLDGIEENVGEGLELLKESDIGALQSTVDALSKLSGTPAGDASTGSTPAPVPVTALPSHLVPVSTVVPALPVPQTPPASAQPSPPCPVLVSGVSSPISPVPTTPVHFPSTSPTPPPLPALPDLDQPPNPFTPSSAAPTSNAPALSGLVPQVPDGTELSFLNEDQDLLSTLLDIGDKVDGADMGPDNYQFPPEFGADLSWLNTFNFPGFNMSGLTAAPQLPGTFGLPSDNLPFSSVAMPGFDIPMESSAPQNSLFPSLQPAVPLPNPSAVAPALLPADPSLLPDIPLPPPAHHHSSSGTPEPQLNNMTVTSPLQLALPTNASANEADDSADASSSLQSRSRSGRHIIPSTRADAMNKIGSFQKRSTDPSNKENIPPGLEHERSAWELAAEAHLTTRDLGDGWTACVNAWVVFEKAMGPNAKGVLPSTKSRPEEWTKWVAKGRHGVRAYNATPTITDPLDFGYAVMAWWKSMQPPFRQSESGLMPKPVYDPPELSVSSVDEWAALRKGGPNGLVSVLTVLVWWGQCMKSGSQWQESSEPHWRACVDNVRQCLEKMKPEAPSRKRASRAKESESGPSKRAKKARS